MLSLWLQVLTFSAQGSPTPAWLHCEWQMENETAPFDAVLIALVDRGRAGVAGTKVVAIHSDSLDLLSPARTSGRLGAGVERMYFHAMVDFRPQSTARPVAGHPRPDLIDPSNVGELAGRLAAEYARENAAANFLRLNLPVSPRGMGQWEVRRILFDLAWEPDPSERRQLALELQDIKATPYVPKARLRILWTQCRQAEGITILMKPDFLNSAEFFPGGDDPPDGVEVGSASGDFFTFTQGVGIALDHVEAIVPHGPCALAALERLRPGKR